MPTMKAWQASAYGAEGNPGDTIASLELKEVEIPPLGPGQLLVKVDRAAVNPIDWKLFSGGLHGVAPCTFPYVPGFDITGTVSALGEDSRLTLCFANRKGNAGAFAEYAVVPVAFAAATHGIDPSAAAGLPLAGLTAYQALFTKAGRSFTGADLGSLKSGDKLLILGGATSVGCFAIQLAKNAGAFVACTASTKLNAKGVAKLEFCKSLGADVVIDYGTAEWSDVLAGKEYDMILDTVGGADDWRDARKVLKKNGEFISVANFAPDTAANTESVFKNYLLTSDGQNLADLVGMVVAKQLVVEIDGVVPFTDVCAALTKSLTGTNAGKIVVQVGA